MGYLCLVELCGIKCADCIRHFYWMRFERCNVWNFLVFFATGILFLLVLFAIVAQSHISASYFLGYPTDGPLQLYNALRRLLDGQVLGRDFHFFHGSGTALIHYIPFLIFGRDLFASEFSRNLISPILFLVSTYVVLYAICRQRFLPFILTLGFFIVSLVGLPSLSSVLVWPGNALMGVRSFVPLFILACIILFYQTKLTLFSMRIIDILASILVAVSYAVGTEQGIAAFAGYVFFLFLRDYFVENRTFLYTICSFLKFFLLTLVSISLLFFAISGSGAYEALIYSIRDVSADQFWYFGVPPNNLIGSVDSGSSLSSYTLPLVNLILSRFGIFYLFSVFFLAVIFYLSKKCHDMRILGIMMGSMYILFYGLFSTFSLFGYASFYYLSIIFRCLIFVGFAILFVLIQKYYSQRRFPFSVSGLVLSFLLIFIFVFNGRVFYLYKILERDLKYTDAYAYEEHKVLGSYLSPYWKTEYLIDSEFIKNPSSLWSMYSGVTEAVNDVFTPASDYIIHSLGPDGRREYVRMFKESQPEYVKTIRTNFFRYSVWLYNSHWDLFEYILKNYKVLTKTGHTIIWKRNDNLNVENVLSTEEWYYVPSADLDKGIVYLYLPSDVLETKNIVSVEVTYSILNPLRFLPFFGALPRFFVLPDDCYRYFKLPVSLPPYETLFTFPILTNPGIYPNIRWETISLLPFVKFNVENVRYKILSVEEITKEAMYDDVPRDDMFPY